MAEGDVIRLEREWHVGAPLGSGGFGQVFHASSAGGDIGVIKLVPKVPGAQRELLFENVSGYPNVMPIWDSGDAGTSWALVMPLADTSLRTLLDDRGGPLRFDEAVPILLDVCTALQAISGTVVHRDIKPDNVLLYGGAWCVADFGISRYAEASTALDTRKYALTPEYAAPEQWRAEHATSATDVYGFGVMAYEMLAGRRPFEGTPDELRDQHLHVESPSLADCPSAVAGLVGECLFKAPAARPTAANILKRLQSVMLPAAEADQRLQRVNQAVGEERARDHAAVSAARSQAEKDAELFDAAVAVLKMVREQLAERIRAAAPLAGADYPFRLGQASLFFDLPGHCESKGFTPFHVVACSQIRITVPTTRHDYEGRAHSLWYCDAQSEDVFRWFETAFMNGLTGPQASVMAPFALQPESQANLALSPGMNPWAVAWPFSPIDQGEGEDFLRRWIDWFAAAAEGKLIYPSRMPERNPQGSWRRS